MSLSHLDPGAAEDRRQDAEPLWPAGWSILGAFGVSAMMWWGLIEAGAALAAQLGR